ncbi:MAG TPA: AraC family transcriptional regulator [Armatimonadota bacterium]|jgi:AraC-like DNA-binding protein
MTYEDFMQCRTPLVRSHLQTLGFAVEYFPHYVNRQLNLHSPGIVLLSFIIKGRGHHILGDETYEEHGGSLGITHYGQFHDILTDEHGMEIMNLYLDLAHHPLPSLPPELQTVLPDIIPLHPAFCHRLNRLVRITFPHDEVITPELYALHRELSACTAGYETAARLHLTLLLIACCRQVQRSGALPLLAALRPGDARVERIRRYLDRHFAEEHSLSTLAAREALTPFVLCRAFKAYTGITLIDYLTQRRVQEAMLRLRTGTEKVSAIALACGFNDLSHFNHKFRAIIGQTPTVYRQRRLG